MSDIRPHIFVVDDDLSVLKTITLVLQDTYSVVVAQSLDEGLSLLRHQHAKMDFAVFLVDQHLGDGFGNTLLCEAKHMFPEATRIIFSGAEDQQATKDAINQQLVHRYITKDASVVDSVVSSCQWAVAEYQRRTAIRESLHRELSLFCSQIVEERAQIILQYLPIATPILNGLAQATIPPVTAIQQWQLVLQEDRYRAGLHEFFSAYANESVFIQDLLKRMDGKKYQTEFFEASDFRNSLLCLSTDSRIWRECHALLIIELLGLVINDGHNKIVQLSHYEND